MNKHERIEADEQLPDFFTGTSFSVMQLGHDIQNLGVRCKMLEQAHAAGSATSMKLSAEAVAKLAGQIQSLSDHLAGVAVRHINRRPR